MSFVDELKAAMAEYGLNATESQIEAFNRYYELLIEWNEKINLTAITAPKEVAIKHIVDSLSCYKAELFKDGTSLIDVGTGAGFPGLPLKIFCPSLKLTLLDSLNKRIKFLQLVVDVEACPGIGGAIRNIGKNSIWRQQELWHVCRLYVNTAYRL